MSQATNTGCLYARQVLSLLYCLFGPRVSSGNLFSYEMEDRETDFKSSTLEAILAVPDEVLRQLRALVECLVLGAHVAAPECAVLLQPDMQCGVLK